jgi:hypothetical protein
MSTTVARPRFDSRTKHRHAWIFSRGIVAPVLATYEEADDAKVATLSLRAFADLREYIDSEYPQLITRNPEYIRVRNLLESILEHLAAIHGLMVANLSKKLVVGIGDNVNLRESLELARDNAFFKHAQAIIRLFDSDNAIEAAIRPDGDAGSA